MEKKSMDSKRHHGAAAGTCSPTGKPLLASLRFVKIDYHGDPT